MIYFSLFSTQFSPVQCCFFPFGLGLNTSLPDVEKYRFTPCYFKIFAIDLTTITNSFQICGCFPKFLNLESVHIHINKASPTERFLFALWLKWWLWFFWSHGCIVNQNILQQSICRRFSFQEDGPMSFRNPTMYTDFLCIHRNVGTDH